MTLLNSFEGFNLFFYGIKLLLTLVCQILHRFILMPIALPPVQLFEFLANLTLGKLSLRLLCFIYCSSLHSALILCRIRPLYFSLRGILRQLEVVCLGESSLLKTLLRLFLPWMLAILCDLLPDFLGIFDKFGVEFLLPLMVMKVDLMI